MEDIERKRLITVAVVIVLSIVASGVWWYASQRSFDPATQSSTPGPTTPTQPPTAPQAPPSSPSAEPDPEAETTPAEREFETTLYFIGNIHTKAAPTYRLYPEKRVIITASNPLVEAARAVVTATSDNPNVINPWPEHTSIEAVVFTGTEDAGGYEVVFGSDTVAQRPQGLSKENAKVALEQLVRSIQLGTSDAPVRFLVAGETDATPPAPLPRLLGVKLTDEGLTPGDDLRYLAPVYITTPTHGEVVDSTFTVAGRAATFEGTVKWELRQRHQAIQEGVATAEECCTFSPYRFDITAPPGNYTLVVKETDPSSGEGKPVASDRRELTVK